MFIFRILKLFYLFLRYNCFFFLGMINHPLFFIFKILYNPQSKSQAKRLRKFCENAGPLFIKLGQILSTRVDILSKIFINELQLLKDSTKSYSQNVLKKAFHKNFEEDVNNIFTHISEKSIGSASIALVFKAHLNNLPVAIKIIKPQAISIINNDIAILNIIFKILEVISYKAKISKLSKLIEHLKYQISFELDLRLESACAQKMAENFKDNPNIYIPKIYWKYTNQNILIQEWSDGIKIDDIKTLQSHNLDTLQITKKFSEIFFYQTLRDGFFHGDIHSGNIFVLTNGKIAFIDFGIMGKLDNKLKYYIKEVFLAFLNKDYNLAAQIHFDAGWVPKKYKVEDFSLACRSIVEKIFDLPQDEIKLGELLQQLFTISSMFEMEIQEDLLILQKNLLYFENLCKILSPKENIWILCKDILNKNIRSKSNINNYVKYKASNFTENLKNDVIDFMSIYNKKKSNHKLIFLNFLLCIIIFFLLSIIIFKDITK